MATYERGTRVRAPFDDVWSFYSTADGLEALTPEFMNLEIHRVVGPDGEEDPEVLVEGTRVTASIRPFGVGPRQRWTSIILERREDDGGATFRDRMVDGPFPEWEHLHRFFDEGVATRVVDRVEYRLPGGPLGRAVSPLGVVGLEPMFRERHRRTKEIFESGDAPAVQ